MGMDLDLKVNLITKDELNLLKKGYYLINKNTLDLIVSRELNSLYKQLAFDIMEAMTTREEGVLRLTIQKNVSNMTLLEYFKEKWEDIIDDLQLDEISIPQEIEEDIYMTYEDWIDCNDVSDYAIIRDVIEEKNDMYILATARYW